MSPSGSARSPVELVPRRDLPAVEDRPQAVEHLQHLPPVAGEAEHQGGAGARAVEGDAHQVAGVEPALHQLPGGLFGPGEVEGAAERQVEEEEQVPAAGGIDRVGRPGGGGDPGTRGDRQVDHLERLDPPGHALVEDLEVVPGQPPDRLAPVDDLDRHLDDGDLGDLAEAPIGRCGRRLGSRDLLRGEPRREGPERDDQERGEDEAGSEGGG